MRPAAAARREAEPGPSGPATANGQLQARCLREIRRAGSAGITLPELGAALDTEWRRLIAPVKELLDESAIEKVESRYYPAG